MQGNSSTLKTVSSTHHNVAQQTHLAPINTISGLLAIALPVVVVCAIVGYRRHRARVIQWQIQRLNRLWQLDCSEKLS
jgi:hypothetical protein